MANALNPRAKRDGSPSIDSAPSRDGAPSQAGAPSRANARSRSRLNLWRILVHLAAWAPLAVLARDFLTDHLTVNPIQAAEIRTGDIALTLLALSLACTPAFTLLRRPQVLRLRRTLGLYGYMYAAIHLTIFAFLDYGLDLGLIGQAIVEKPYIIVGFTCFIVLSLLAITSFKWWKARLGKNWKCLHQLIYAINLLVVLHFGWSVKGDFFHLRGDIFRPLASGVIILLLLIFRIPAVRRSIAHQPKATSSPVPFSTIGAPTAIVEKGCHSRNVDPVEKVSTHSKPPKENGSPSPLSDDLSDN